MASLGQRQFLHSFLSPGFFPGFFPKNNEIASELGIGTHVVRNYLSAIYDKIGVSKRVELALWYEAPKHEGFLPAKGG